MAPSKGLYSPAEALRSLFLLWGDEYATMKVLRSRAPKLFRQFTNILCNYLFYSLFAHLMWAVAGYRRGRARPFSLYTSPARGLQKINSQQSSENTCWPVPGKLLRVTLREKHSETLKSEYLKSFDSFRCRYMSVKKQPSMTSINLNLSNEKLGEIAVSQTISPKLSRKRKICP